MVDYLTRKKTLMGVNYQEEVKLEQYGGAVVKIHALPDLTIAKIEAQVGFTLEEALAAISSMGLSDAELADMQAGRVPEGTIEKAGQAFSPRFKMFLAEICKAGIVPDPNCACKGKGCDNCNVAAMVEELRGFALLQIGIAIIAASTAKWDDVEAFFSRGKERSGAE